MRELLTDANLGAALNAIPQWEHLTTRHAIERTYTFQTFSVAMRFVNAVADAATELDHHPDMDIRWNKVRMELSTHSAGGLTRLDIILATQADELADDIGMKVVG